MTSNTPNHRDHDEDPGDRDGSTEDGSGLPGQRRHRSTLRDSMVRFDGPRAKPDAGELDEL